MVPPGFFPREGGAGPPGHGGVGAAMPTGPPTRVEQWPNNLTVCCAAPPCGPGPWTWTLMLSLRCDFQPCVMVPFLSSLCRNNRSCNLSNTCAASCLQERHRTALVLVHYQLSFFTAVDGGAPPFLAAVRHLQCAGRWDVVVHVVDQHPANCRKFTTNCPVRPGMGVKRARAHGLHGLFCVGV
jgi:hypothetical protein